MAPHEVLDEQVTSGFKNNHNVEKVESLTVSSSPHPLDPLSVAESDKARQAVLDARGSKVVLKFRSIFMNEPLKKDLVPYLEVEHSGTLSSKTQHPARQAYVQYDVVSEDGNVQFTESIINVATGVEDLHRPIGKPFHSALTTYEFGTFNDACLKSPLFQEAISRFKLPEGFVLQIDPWPYGGPDPEERAPRYMQGLCFAKDNSSGNPDSNHYGYPIPIIPVMDSQTLEIVRVDKLSTGGKDDSIYNTETSAPGVIDHCLPAEYVPELLSKPMRSDIKALNVAQPDGPSFKVSNESLIEWQKWRFRLGFNPREGAVLHDVTYDNRSVLYRLSISEMTVPYGDPRPPFHRKQAFDFGDAGAGRAANNLSLGCDCLGVIKYFNSVETKVDGSSSVSKNVVCLHEQDNGIGWKHTNFRTQRAVVTRSRELVVQFIITLANYEYIFAYKLDQAGGITVETRATGIVSVVNIDPGKTSQWGNVVSPGALAQNHQHIFCVRIDPSIDGHSATTVFNEESLPMEISKDINPWGNGYEVRSTPIIKPCFLDASPMTNRTIKLSNVGKKNRISGKPVSYKFIPAATQLLLAHPDSIQSRRAQFARHHVWVTKHKDGELWAGGEFTNQSQNETDGVADAVARGEGLNPHGDNVVVWNVFGLTHNPRVEDWPVMPVEIHQLHIKPSDFFESNPAIDVPGTKNTASILANGAKDDVCCGNGEVQSKPQSHLQGSGPDIIPS